GYDDLFQLLIEQEHGSNDITSSLDGALFDAVDQRHYHFIKPLVNKGAHSDWPNTRSDYYYGGRSAIDIAIEQKSEDAIKLLLRDDPKKRLPNFISPAYGGMGFIIGAISGLFPGLLGMILV